ncbi:MAG TPA: ribosome maturation factor RimM [Thermoanaerobaculia bacterium]|nr:ribosome maturation factor RimM [Thermoanaerobaculia bacterium]
MLLVGIVRKPHGLTGEVSVELATDFPQRFAPGIQLVWTRGTEERSLELAAARPHGKRLLLTFEGIASVEEARDLAGGDLSIPHGEAFPAPSGFFYSHELEGFACVDEQGTPLGVVRGLGQTPAGPLLTLETVAGKEALVPFVEEMVRKIDREGRRIVLELPEGLLDL